MWFVMVRGKYTKYFLRAFVPPCIVFCLFLLLLSCTTTSIPPWYSSHDAIRMFYPDSEYIAQRGRGATRAAAEANGAAQIALFFNSQIRSELRIAERETIINGFSQSSSDIESELFIKAEINLFGIRYAQDAYYNRAQNEWVTVAYINRNEAWLVYSPRFKQQAESFTQLLTAAENEADPFRKVLRLTAARNFSQTHDYQNMDIFGQLLNPLKMNEEFAAIRTQVSRLPVLLDNARKNASIYIDCPGDFESLITNAFSREFADIGFPVAYNRNNASAICRVIINEGMQQRDLGIFYHPSLQAVISSNVPPSAGSLFTFNAEGERAQAVTPDVAKRRAYQSLAEKVRVSFKNEFNKHVY